MFARGPQPGATPKADALKHYPDAWAYEWADGWVIYNTRRSAKQAIAYGKTASQAWRNVPAPCVNELQKERI